MTPCLACPSRPGGASASAWPGRPGIALYPPTHVFGCTEEDKPRPRKHSGLWSRARQELPGRWPDRQGRRDLGVFGHKVAE